MSSSEIIRIIIAACAAYLIGNINPAIIIGKIKGIDIRKEGSGNAGMTNTIRVMGLGAGITVLAIDVLKAFISVKFGYYLCGAGGAMAAFAGVVLGHCYPVFFGFKGGKGVAASLGAAFALNWPSAFAALIIAGILFAVTRRMSLASLGGALSYPLFIWHFSPVYLCFSICAAAYLVFMHRANIKRLLNGEEEVLTVGGKGHEKEQKNNESD